MTRAAIYTKGRLRLYGQPGVRRSHEQCPACPHGRIERRMIRMFVKTGTKHFQVLRSAESPLLNYRRPR